MKIHSNILTQQDIRDCVPDGCYLAGHYARNGVDWASIHEEGSRSHARGFTVRLSGSSKSVMQSLPDRAATWDEWGIFLAAIYERDPDALCGWYKTHDDFILRTTEEAERIAKFFPADSVEARTHQAPWLKTASV